MNAKLLAAAALTSLSAGAAAHAQSADWGGFYAGGAVGYSKAAENSGERLAFDTNRDGVYNDTVRTTLNVDAFSPGFCSGAAIGRTPAEGCRTTDGNLDLSVRVGYDWAFGPVIVGIVGDVSQSHIGDDVSGFSTTPASYTFSRDLDHTIAARVRAGYAFSRFLAYGTGGVAKGTIEHSFSTTNTANSFTRFGEQEDNTGFQFGGGIEMLLGDNFSLGVEYLRTSLDDENYVVDVGRGTAPLTNPFLLVSPDGTFMQRSENQFEYDTFSLTMIWRP